MAQLTRFYIYKLTNAQGPVTLTVTLGNAQAGTSDLYLNEKTLQTAIQDSFTFDVQDPVSLSGKELDISSTLVDVNPDSDDISYRIKLSGGQSVLNPPADRIRIETNGRAYFLTKIIFV